MLTLVSLHVSSLQFAPSGFSTNKHCAIRRFLGTVLLATELTIFPERLAKRPDRKVDLFRV